MNEETDQWESYIDRAGRQHWRWPAANVELAARLVDDEQRHEPKFQPRQNAEHLPE
jgi:hypothetical protein